MQKMQDVQEIKDYLEEMLLKSGEVQEDELESSDWYGDGHEAEYLFFKIPDVVQHIETQGGEGEGEYYHIVFKVIREGQEDTFIMYVGHYDSWSGTSWYEESFKVVKPVQKTITVYE